MRRRVESEVDRTGEGYKAGTEGKGIMKFGRGTAQGSKAKENRPTEEKCGW